MRKPDCTRGPHHQIIKIFVSRKKFLLVKDKSNDLTNHAASSGSLCEDLFLSLITLNYIVGYFKDDCGAEKPSHNEQREKRGLSIYNVFY